MKNEITKYMLSTTHLFTAMNFFDIEFCRNNNADLAFTKMIIDCELKYRLYKVDNPDSGFIILNNNYWYKFNIQNIYERFPIFHREKMISLINQLLEMKLYKIIGSLEEEEILILLEE